MKTLFRTCKSSLKRIPVTKNELNLRLSLLNGQAFCWSAVKDSEFTKFEGVIGDFYVKMEEREADGVILFSTTPEKKTEEGQKEIDRLMEDYFQLSFDYEALVEDWKARDKHFHSVANKFKGLRILRQDPFECLVSFLCSQNNNIPRITKILLGLRQRFGVRIHEGFFSFPTPEALRKANEKEFRDIGLGYRAKYIVESLEILEANGGVGWLHSLRGKGIKTVRDELLKLKGVGNKVADCISLFSLDCRDAIPVDTHVWQIYTKVYKNEKGKHEKMTNKAQYEKVVSFFQNKFGDYAGWAHSYLFTADLGSFKKDTPSEKKETEKEKRGNMNLKSESEVKSEKIVSKPDEKVTKEENADGNDILLDDGGIENHKNKKEVETHTPKIQKPRAKKTKLLLEDPNPGERKRIKR